MPRQNGLFSFSGNFEPRIAEPLDSRLKVKTLKSLCSKDTWISTDGVSYIYKGMVVAVTDDPNGYNNGLCFWIALGGVVYTLGMIPFCTKKSNCAHFIWHFFVLFGCILQWIGIYAYLY